jgi:hypothetical protein
VLIPEKFLETIYSQKLLVYPGYITIQNLSPRFLQFSAAVHPHLWFEGKGGI